MSDQTNKHDRSHADSLSEEATGKSSRAFDRGKRWDRDNDGWWEDRSIAQKVVLGIGFGILIIGGISLIGLLTMHLWNWLMPEIFGLPHVNYWQTWGLLILSCILFKNIGSGNSSRHSDRKRKRHLRRYMRENQTLSGDAPEKSPQSV